MEYVARKTKMSAKLSLMPWEEKRLTHSFDLPMYIIQRILTRLRKKSWKTNKLARGLTTTFPLFVEKVPTHWEIGRVMQRLIVEVAEHTKTDVIEALIKVYNSWIVTKIDRLQQFDVLRDTSYQYASYEAGMAL